jgi:nucleoside-diphosphate-sugar epimerase
MGAPRVAWGARSLGRSAFKMRFTVLGGRGYLGSHLGQALRKAGHEVILPGRDEPLPAAAGHVVFCIGVASDFRRRPNDTIRAHVVELERYLSQGGWSSFLYLSSTRVYAGGTSGREDATLLLRPGDPDHIYNLSKATGEALCLTLNHPGLRVVRLSNVYGDDAGTGTFIADVLRDARSGAVHFGMDAASEKDYVALEDVLDLLPRVALAGRGRLYNVAAGRNVRAGEIAAVLERAGVSCTFAEGGPVVRFPAIAIDRVVAEFGFRPQQLLESLPAMLSAKES